MATVTRSSRKLKDDDINNSKKQTGIKDASTSGSTTTDTSGLRRSTRETPTKKQKTSSSSSTRKSERIEKRAPPTPPTCLGKRKSERVEKQIMASPSRTSDKGEKTSSLSSSASKKSKKNSSMDTKISKDPKLKSGIEPTHSAVGRDKNLKDNPISVRAKKKTRLDARTYRAFLTPRTTKLKESGPSKQLNVHDDSFQGDTENTVTNGVSVDEKNVKEGEDNPVERGGKEIGRRCVESRDGDDEESIPVPGRSVEKSDGEKNSCHFSRIPRNHLAEKNVEEGEDNCIEREGEKEIVMSCVEGREGAVEEFSPVSRHFAEMTSIGDKEIKLSHFCKKHNSGKKNVEEVEYDSSETEKGKETGTSFVESCEETVEESRPVSRKSTDTTVISDGEIELSHFSRKDKNHPWTKNVEEGEDDFSEKEGEKEIGLSCMKGREDAIGESSPVSRKSTEMTVISDGEIELSHFSRKDKNHPWTKNVEDGEDDSSEKEGEKEIGLSCMKGREEAIGESSFFSRKSSKRTLVSDGEVKLSHYSRKFKNHPGETSDAKHGDNSSVIVQSTPDVVMAIEITVDIDPMQIDSLTKKDLQQPVLKSISDVSGTEQNYEFCTSNCADDVPSLPCGSNSDDLVGRCNGCSKRLRVDIDLQTRDVCSCNSQNNYELRETSFPEEVCEQSPILISPENGVMLVSSTQTNGADLECSELLPEAERSTAQDSPGLHSTSEIPSPLKKDRAEHETRSRIVVTEEHSEGGQLEISPLVIQKVTNGNACFICKLGEKLLCCEGKGCKKSYHLLCLDPPLKDVPSGIWYCLFCTKKKILSGVHSVSEGVESVWDAREEEVPDCDGMQIPKQKQMQYFVKYRGLAHVHNRWIPEDQLLLDAPTVVAEFKRNQTQMWKSEWIKPQRLLQKRLLMSEEQRTEYLNQHLSDISNCSYEWFVKWSCLGYEHATWELENASFLKSPEALTLKRGYESRLEKPIRVCESSRSDKEMNPSLIKLSKLPDVGIPVPDQYHHLSSVNKLREYWQKGHSAVIIEDQERVLKVILFILSLHSDTCRPFLLISSSPAIYTWEAEFLRLAPSVNVVVYNGNKGARGIIRAVEFYDDGGRVIFQILLSTPDVIVEDLELIKHLGWEAIIIDECQRYRVSKHFEQFKGIITHFKLLLVTGSIKDSVPEYLNLLSLIDSQDDKNVVDNLKMDTNDNIGKLRERFAQFFVCERKSESSKFVEYWVPVRLSEVQLEQYCFSLLTNITFLRSCSKNDPVGALCDILIATKKCCDHPYLVDPSLQTSLTKDLIGYEEYLKVGVNASGKLLFLDKFLSEVKKRGLRVLILFQSIGGSRNIIGDIIEDFVRQRFGHDSYERVDIGLQTSRKQAALTIFNDKERGRFVFLLENRACLPSIKLSLVDVVVLFDSDWNPSNDLKALQKIHLDPECEPIKVFRLYSSCTVEEKALILAKQDMALDSNVQNINRSVSHSLLTWGASYLMKMLDEFHGSCTRYPASSIVFEQSFLNDVVQELLTQLPRGSTSYNSTNCSFGTKVQKIGSTYSNDIFLLGEMEMQEMNEEPLVPHVFWTDLLDGRYPQWRYLSAPSPRVRRKPQYFDDVPKKPAVESDEVMKKRKKVVNTLDSTGSPKLRLGKVAILDNQGTSGHPSGSESQALPCSSASMNIVDLHPLTNDISGSIEDPRVESAERRNLSDLQKALHLPQKQQISNLCEILQFPEDVNRLAQRFLEYLANKRRVFSEAVTILQAFQLSLCWCAASLLKHKVSRDQSLALAKQRLGFECKLEEAKCVHKELKKLMKLFTYDMDSSSKEVGKERVSQSAQSDQQELEGEVRESSPSLDCSEQRVSDKQDQTTPKSEKANGSRKSDLNKIIKEVHKISSKRRRSLGDKQMSELQEFYKKREESREREKAELFEKHRLESALIRTTTQMSVRSDKLKKVDEELTRKLEELNFRIETEKKEFEDKLNRARDRERRMKTHWLNEAKSGRSVTSFSLLPLPDSGFSMENMVTSEQAGVWDVREKTSTSAVPSSEINDFGGDILVMPVEDEPAEGLNNHANGAIEADIPTETSTQSTYPDGENDGIEIRASEEVALTGANHHRVASDSEDGRSTSLGQTQIAPSADTVEVPLHQVFCADGHPQPAISDRVQGDHMSSCEVPSTSQHFECSQVVSAEEHAQPSISDMLQCNNVSSSEVPSTSEQGEPSHQSILPPVTQLEIPPSIDPSYVEHVQPNPPTIREIEHQESQVPIGQPTEVQTELYINSGLQSQPELHHDYQSRQTSSNHAQVPQLSSEGHIVQFNHPISQPNAHLPDPRTIGAVPESSYRTPQTGPSTSRASMPFSTDPLENELQRLNKEDEISIKKHEHRKMELTSNCEKEIEEIRRKYNTQIHDAETVFVENRKIRESIFNKILMNKMLANTFSFKCTYAVAKSTGSTALQHGVYPGSVHQLSQLSSPPISQRPIYVPSPSVAPPAAPVAALPTASLAAPSLQMVHNSSAPAAPPLQVRYSSAPTAPPVPVAKHYLSTPAALPVPAVNHHPSAPMAPAVTPPLQVVHHSSALFSSIVRPHFNPVSPVVSHQVGSEIRAPAPHLQSFRPAPLVTSVMVSGQQSHKSPQIPRVPSYASVPFSRMHPTDCARGPAVGHPSFSHVDLLRDVDNRHAENQRNLLPPLPDLSPSVDAWVLQGPTAHTIIASDVVCLSDDD